MKFDVNDLEKGMEIFEDKVERGLNMYAHTSALKLQNYARQHRPWTDRTAHARQRLSGTVTKIANGFRLVLSHGVSYGKYLEATNNPKQSKGKNQLTGLEAEFKYERKYAIINPTLKAKSPEILKGLQNLFDKIQ